MVQARKHSKYSPSQSELFINCPGSSNLRARVPALSSDEASEGDKAHAVFEHALTCGYASAFEAHLAHPELSQEILDEPGNEFYTSVDLAIDEVHRILAEHPGSELHVEQYVEPPTPETGGYSDVQIYARNEKTLYVIDYKHGVGVAKDAVGNTQLMQYGIGALHGSDAPIEEVVLMIIQPRAFHKDGPVRVATYTPGQLWEHWWVLDAAVAASKRPDAPLIPGPWCTEAFCDAVGNCPARQANAVAPLQAAGQPVTTVEQAVPSMLPDPVHLTADKIALICKHAPELRKWLKTCEDQAHTLLRLGVEVPGKKLVEAKDQRRYHGDKEDVATRLAAMIGCSVDMVYETKLPTITDAEKKVKKAYQDRAGKGGKKRAAEQAKRAFAQLTLKDTSGKLVMADEDDPRPAVTSEQKAKQGFQAITGLIPNQT